MEPRGPETRTENDEQHVAESPVEPDIHVAEHIHPTPPKYSEASPSSDRRIRQRQNTAATTTSSLSSSEREEAAHTSHTPQSSRHSSADSSHNSQTPTVKHSNSTAFPTWPPTWPRSTNSLSQFSLEDDSQAFQEEEEEEEDVLKDNDDESQGHASLVVDSRDGTTKSLGSSIFASLAPLKSWRDVTLGEIIDGITSVFPEVTSGDLSCLAQLFFDNLSTILAALYAIQDLARIAPSATTPEGTVLTATDDNIDKNVSLQTINRILFENVATGLGLALFFGNTYYSWLATRQKREYGRDYTALPTGISTPYAFAMVFNIIYPIYYQERSKENVSGDEAFLTAYRVSLAANFVSGLINCGFGIFGPWILRIVPPHILLIPAAGICIAFLGLEQITKSFAAPIVGINALFWVYLSWYANVRIGWGKWRMPEALQVLIVGVVLGWATGLNDPQLVKESAQFVGWVGPSWAGSQLWGDDFGRIQELMGLIIPLGITAPTLSLMCLVSTKEAGDPYPVRESLIVDGLATCLASVFGCPFGTVVYIGHPSHKRSGALVSYSFLNGILYLVFSWFGILALINSIVNPAAVGPIVFLIGLYVNEDVLDFLAPRHFAAYFIGIIPSICDWVVTVSGRTPVQDIDPNGNAYNTQLLGASSNWFGILALKRGSLLVSLFWGAIAVNTIDRRFLLVSLWSLTAAVFAMFGLIHAPQAGFEYLNQTHWEQCDAKTDDCWENADQWMFPTAYLMLATTSLIVHFCKRCDPAIRDKIYDKNYSAAAFENWFANAHKQTFVAEDNRSQTRSYLPAIREIQQFQRHALQSDDFQHHQQRPEDHEDEDGPHSETMSAGE